ncbi:GtrA family protein [Arenimonas composti]|uniref:GtrA/DPMS transmembrane domain-containing protein n=1 Tax=Arenimonas composti TR7-09 = DSM 18010 TaxID=1121013 RepID=A0A091BB99_9GAMM|nr:GtrA family protein [Arenimonas composti]KFN48792.1 hypothetical protein P873_13350 [Arenimonas composti TR7-09 = DSM 18010]
MTSPSPALPRQFLRFLVVGFAQLGLDSLVYIAASALGTPVVVANIAGRLAGVSLGFWAHGRWTFADAQGHHLHGRALLRFVISWTTLTAASTLLVAKAADAFGLHWSWLAKPFVEGVLAGVSFLVLRYWVFRSRRQATAGGG